MLPDRFGLLSAQPGWRSIDLLSDVHLHQDMPRTFDAWSRHLLQTPADAVLILGDLFEVWVGDDARHQDFERECAQVLRAAARRCSLAFMPGNRDFLVGQDLLAECGIVALADPTVLEAFGQRWLLTHGDALCLSDEPYQRFRVQVRDPAWQRRFLEQPLVQRQAQARAMREASETHQAGMAGLDPPDVDNAAAAEWLQAAHANVMVHGHTHRPATHALPGGGVRHVMGDWDFDRQPPRARMLRLTSDGLQVVDLGTASTAEDHA